MRNSDLVSTVFDKLAPSIDTQRELLARGGNLFPDISKFFSNQRTLIGIEVEVEGAIQPALVFWNTTEDGSLRNDGFELVSLPVMGRNIDYALAELGEWFSKEKHSWSHRCSIHVHVNAQMLSVEQVKLLLASYACIENLFFSLVSAERRGNPYCYPITDLNPSSINLGDHGLKYCAINVGNSLVDLGTIEFRHMDGNDNLIRIRRWIQLITKLHTFVKNGTDIKSMIESLDSESSYWGFVKAILKGSHVVYSTMDIVEEMINGVMWAKVYLNESVK